MDFLLAFLLAILVACGSTFPLWSDAGEGFGLLLILSFPGALIAVPLGLWGVVGSAHDPNVVVIAVVDTLFYTWFFYWLMTRRLRSNG